MYSVRDDVRMVYVTRHENGMDLSCAQQRRAIVERLAKAPFTSWYASLTQPAGV
jgi:hypothetical protein